MPNKRLEQIKADGRYAEIKLTAEIRLTREKHREKQQQAEAKELLKA